MVRIYKISNQKGQIKLSVKNELITLKQKKETLEKSWQKFVLLWIICISKKRPIVQRVKALSTRTSSIAQLYQKKLKKNLKKSIKIFLLMIYNVLYFEK